MTATKGVMSLSLALVLSLGGVYASAQESVTKSDAAGAKKNQTATDSQKIDKDSDSKSDGVEGESISDRIRRIASERDNQSTLGSRERGGDPSGRTFQQVTQSWKPQAKELAKQLVAKYGEPDEVTAQRLIWHNNGPWLQTELVNEAIPHSFPEPHMDMLKQTIALKVPTNKLVELAKFDSSVIVDATSGRLSARCGKEEMNYLALNLAHDIISEKKSVKEARDMYTKSVAAFMDGEKADPYTQKLHFQAARIGDVSDLQKPSLNKQKK